MSFFFLHIFFTIKNPSLITLRFPNPFALTPETRVVPRRRPPPTTNIIMSFFGSGQSKLLSVDVTFATRTCVVKSSYTDANHVARETLPLITSGTPICDVCEEEDERLEGKRRRGDDDSLAVFFFVFLLVSTTTLMTLSLLTKLLCALKGDSIEGVLHVSPGTPKTRRVRAAIYLCRCLGVPLLWSL